MSAASLVFVSALAFNGGDAQPLDRHMDAAYVALTELGYCAERAQRDEWLRADKVLSARYAELDDRASGLFGSDIDQDGLAADHRTPPLCNKDHPTQRAIETATQALDAVELALVSLEQALGEGLWVGAFRACAETLESSEYSWGYDVGGSVRIVFRHPYSQAFKDYGRKFAPKTTTLTIDGKLVEASYRPDVMLVRLGGKPYLGEVLFDGNGVAVVVRGFGVRAVQAAARRPCDPPVTP